MTLDQHLWSCDKRTVSSSTTDRSVEWTNASRQTLSIRMDRLFPSSIGIYNPDGGDKLRFAMVMLDDETLADLAREIRDHLRTKNIEL